MRHRGYPVFENFWIRRSKGALPFHVRIGFFSKNRQKGLTKPKGCSNIDGGLQKTVWGRSSAGRAYGSHP